MAERTCDVDECTRTHLAKGLCRQHYNHQYKSRPGYKRTSYPITCATCGEKCQSARRNGKFCSDLCKGLFYSDTMRTKSPLPQHHPVMVLIAEARKPKPREPKRSTYEWRTARECPGCACLFTPLYTPNAITCSKRCSRRVHRWRRKASERNATGTFTWSEFMQVARRFNYLCAYCGTRDGQLEPDHVVPLSRGGSNSTTNLLPSCRTCNGNKSAMLLDEWAVWRAGRGETPLATHWAPEDKRYWHLTSA